jgi:DNA-binding NarL/FixJ family response regulator
MSPSDMRRQATILIADQDEDVRRSLTALFAEESHPVVEAATGEQALAHARRVRPALAVLEVCLPGLSGYEVCHAIREKLGDDVSVILISARRAEPVDRVAGLLLGADECLAKPLIAGELLVRARRLMRRSPGGAPNSLTTREREVLGLLVEGLDDREIAARLVISRNTVGTHVDHIFAKLGVHSRGQAVALAYRNHLLEPAANGSSDPLADGALRPEVVPTGR